MKNPTTELPRDMTGSYLHLKLKRFPGIENLTMPFAKKTWQQHPHDAEVDMSPSNRSKCRQCHNTILTGELRMRLWLQCHKGCKNSAYFHGEECFWKYPETGKLDSVSDLKGFETLSKKVQEQVKSNFETLVKVGNEYDSEVDEPLKKKRRK